VLSILAKRQRELIVANTRVGLAAARARGRTGGPDSTPGRSPSHKSSTTSATTPSSRSPTPSARPAPPPTGTSTTRARASARPFTANRRATPEHQSAETSRRGSLRKWRLVTRFLPRPQIARRRRSGGRSGQAATAAERRSGGTHYLTDHTQADLAGSGIHLPPLASYVDRLVEFMELHPEIGSAAMTKRLRRTYRRTRDSPASSHRTRCGAVRSKASGGSRAPVDHLCFRRCRSVGLAPAIA
jgi:hypothetical protein